MKLVKHFNTFLGDVVNIDDGRLELLDRRVTNISDFLADAPVIGDMYIDVIPQGSMAHKTIIKPLPDHEFDADIVLLMTPQDNWRPKDYIEQLYQAFRTNGNYKDRVSRKNRCVRIDYAGDCHVDVVPLLELQPGEFYITNKREGEDGIYEKTDPTGYTEWLDGQNRIAGGQLIKAIRLLKWLRDYKGTFSCKSVLLNVLVAERVNSVHLLSDDKYYSDLPTTLVHLLEDLRDYLASYPTYMPRIQDPTCPEVDYNHRWDNDQYLNFRNKIDYYAGKARAAYDESDRAQSIKLWQELFGVDFAPQKLLTANALSEDVDKEERLVDPGEQFIDKMFPMALNPAYRLKVAGTVMSRDGHKAHYVLASRGSRVAKKRSIKFRIQHTTVPGDYSVWWKVKNRGHEAREATCLRGEIVEGETRSEPTAYRGNHYVECYIVKDGVCVAMDRQPVTIT